MPDVLRGLYARRADLERRISIMEKATVDAEACIAVDDADEHVLDLLLQLRSVVNQIGVYAASGERWGRSA